MLVYTLTNDIGIPRTNRRTHTSIPADTDPSLDVLLHRHMALVVSVLPDGYTLETRERTLQVCLAPHVFLRRGAFDWDWGDGLMRLGVRFCCVVGCVVGM